MNNKTNELISVIVPVYNVSKYLRKCIDSILSQTYTNLEIILINDGSTDNCHEICDYYAGMDKRIKVIHKKNGGLSSARNCGLQIATGEYIGFVDSDDYINPSMYELLYCNLISSSADLSMCGYYHTYTDNEISNSNKINKIIVTDAKGALEILLKGKLSTIMAWNKLYKKDIFESLVFPVGKTMEDAFIIVEIISFCKKVVVDTSPQYHYVHRSNSITSTPYDKSTIDIVDAYIHILDLVTALYPDLVYIAVERLIWANLIVLDKMLMSTTNELEINKIVKYIRKNIFKILKSNFFNKKRKIGACILFFNIKAYKKLVYLQNNNKEIRLESND